MSVIEIVGGVILLIASLVIVFLTPADQMLAKTTRIAGIVFFVVAILACLFAGRLAG